MAANFTRTSLPGFTVVGPVLHANYLNGEDGKLIAAHWQRFFADETAEQIPQQDFPGTFYGVYSHYLPNGNYRLLIGPTVRYIGQIPANCEVAQVPAQEYAIFTTSGPPETAVAETWRTIRKAKIVRTFGCDFEVYDDESHGAHPTVKIYVAVR